MNDELEFEPVEPYVHIVDAWPPETLTHNRMQAYKMMIDDRLIKIKKAITWRGTHEAVIDYMSTLPEDWTHEILREMTYKFAREEEDELSDS